MVLINPIPSKYTQCNHILFLRFLSPRINNNNNKSKQVTHHLLFTYIHLTHQFIPYHICIVLDGTIDV